MTELSDEQVDNALALAIPQYDPRDRYPEWSNGSMRDAYRAGYSDGMAEVQLIETVAELDALPDETIVRSVIGVAYERYGTWDGGQSKWLVMGNDPPDDGDSIELPARVLWSPEDDRMRWWHRRREEKGG